MIFSRRSCHIGFLILLCGVLYLPNLGRLPFFDKGEPREALAVQDIVQRGEWLFPLKRASAIPSKPPLFHWSAAVTYQFTGQLNEATIRFPSVFYATLGVLLIYLLGCKLFGAETGLLAGGILATTMVYQAQAMDARVDMTLCFFVTASLVLFYMLYRGFLSHSLWYYGLYSIVGLGTMAKGPLGILLPGLVIAVFLMLKRRWDLVVKFAFHPGVILSVVLVVGWYGFAISRGGEGFVNRQLLEENFERFFGGSGHTHPIHYYLPYIFSQGLPWTLFLPVLLWDLFRAHGQGDDTLFLKTWLFVMFAFFSVSMGKRPVYLLPLYPAIALLLAHWFIQHGAAAGARLVIYRVIALVGGIVAVTLLLVGLGDLWSHDPGWFVGPIEGLLKPKDRANFLVIKNQLDSFGWVFIVLTLLSAIAWLGFARLLWRGRMRLSAVALTAVAALAAMVARGMVLPEIAEARSYRAFARDVQRLVSKPENLHRFGREFNSDSLTFYLGRDLESVHLTPEAAADSLGKGDHYLIMTKQSWEDLQRLNPSAPEPLLVSKGSGPEGDAILVLVAVPALPGT